MHFLFTGQGRLLVSPARNDKQLSRGEVRWRGIFFLQMNFIGGQTGKARTAMGEHKAAVAGIEKSKKANDKGWFWACE